MRTNCEPRTRIRVCHRESLSADDVRELIGIDSKSLQDSQRGVPSSPFQGDRTRAYLSPSACFSFLYE